MNSRHLRACRPLARAWPQPTFGRGPQSIVTSALGKSPCCQISNTRRHNCVQVASCFKWHNLVPVLQVLYCKYHPSSNLGLKALRLLPIINSKTSTPQKMRRCNALDVFPVNIFLSPSWLSSQNPNWKPLPVTAKCPSAHLPSPATWAPGQVEVARYCR